MGVQGELLAHLQTGVTTVCRAWAITRRDGAVFGFTDHDLSIAFDGITFAAETGLSALALQQSTGLSVDNTEALGALSQTAVSEADIEAGRFDGADVVSWLVNWDNVTQRHVLFRGSIGELRRVGGAFQAELRGLTEVLNKAQGRVYQKPCTAVLGDKACGFDIAAVGFFEELQVANVTDNSELRFAGLNGPEEGWFARGVLLGIDGACADLRGMIKRDYFAGEERVIELWHPMRADLVAGDVVRLIAGCDKRMNTCQTKFANLLNYQGFPDIPGDNWLVAQPGQSGNVSGGSRR